MKSLFSILTRFALGGALLCLPLMVRAQDYPQAGTRQPDEAQSNKQNVSPLSQRDKTFVDKAAQGGLAEVELGNLATQKATNPDVKKFAERMVHDHSQVNKELNQLADREGITLPKRLSAKDEMLKTQLEKLNGEAFDKAYMQNQVQDHEKDIAAFQHEGQEGQNASVKEFASQTTPLLQSHLQEAESVAPKVQAASNSSAR